MESLEINSKTREEYTTFISDYQNYFQQPKKEKQVMLKGLMVDPDFKRDFTLYRKEASEATQITSLALLTPTLEESTVASMITEMDKLQSFFKEDAEKLPECIRLINKVTSQYVTELDYAAQAVRDEANAKIKAQEELVNPQIATLNTEYKRKVANLTRSIDDEIESLKKLQSKTETLIENDEEKIRQYQREAKRQAEKNHVIYEKRWKERSGQTKKELAGLKKERASLEKRIKNLARQKTEETSKLAFKLEAEIKLARQPLIDLAEIRDAKMLVFKQETERLIKQEKPVAEGLYGAIRQRESINARFEALGIREQQLKSPALFYVPFYTVCYQEGLSRRYIFLPPSTVHNISFSARLKGALGMSKIKEAFIARFRSITALIDNCQVLVKQDMYFESELGELGEKNNILNTRANLDAAAKGLVYIKHEGWLSDKEYQTLSDSLKSL
jgi:hypothetical protein